MRTSIAIAVIIICLTALYFKHTENIERPLKKDIAVFEKQVKGVHVYKEYGASINYYVPSETFTDLILLPEYNYICGMGNKAMLISMNLQN